MKRKVSIFVSTVVIQFEELRLTPTQNRLLFRRGIQLLCSGTGAAASQSMDASIFVLLIHFRVMLRSPQGIVRRQVSWADMLAT